MFVYTFISILLVWFSCAKAIGGLGLEKGIAMKKILRNTRLVSACLNFLGGIARLVAALINMDLNYSHTHANKVGS